MKPTNSCCCDTVSSSKEGRAGGIMYPLSRNITKGELLRLLVVATSLAILLSQLYKIFSSFRTNSILISITKSQVSSLPFPAVTICRSSALSRKSKPTEHPLFTNYSDEDHFFAQDNHVVLRAYVTQDHFSSYDSLEQVKNASANPHEFFLTKFRSSCTFEIINTCNYPANITEVISPYQGICYRFNGDGTLQQRDASSFYGLSMIIFANQSDFVPLSTFDLGSGIAITIHPPEEYSFPDMSGLTISPGFLTTIALKKVVNKRLSPPYSSKCTNGENMELFFPGKYTISSCKLSCMIRGNLNDCDTAPPLTMMFLEESRNYKSRRVNKTMLKCIMDSEAKSISPERRECECPVPCNEETYVPTLSQTKWPSKADLPYYKRAFAYALDLEASNITDEFIYENFLQLKIYIDEMSFTTIVEREEWTVEKLISDVGGQLGIWTGLSTISLFDLAVRLVKIFKKNCPGRKDTEDTALEDDVCKSSS